jgi:hypothetical protein
MNTPDVTAVFIESMKPLVPFFVFIVIASAVLNQVKSKKRKSGSKEYKYQKRFLMSVNEKAFYNELSVICKKLGFLLFSKVRLIDLIEPVSKDDRGAKQHVIQKHVDFVLCHSSTLMPVLVIELDDKSHDSERRQQKDADKDKALESAGLPILRTRSSARLEENIIRALDLTAPIHR